MRDRLINSHLLVRFRCCFSAKLASRRSAAGPGDQLGRTITSGSGGRYFCLPVLGRVLLDLPSGVHRPASGLSNPWRSLGSLPHREMLLPAPIIASQARDFNIPDLGGRVRPRSVRTAYMTFLPDMRSDMLTGSGPALDPAVALGSPRPSAATAACVRHLRSNRSASISRRHMAPSVGSVGQPASMARCPEILPSTRTASPLRSIFSTASTVGP